MFWVVSHPISVPQLTTHLATPFRLCLSLVGALTHKTSRWYQKQGLLVGPQCEDCLIANIWSAANKTNELRPVVVFIYRGGFEFGSSSQPVYGGTKFAEEGTVLIAFNYCLRTFRFLVLPQLDSKGTNSGMFGLQDQIFALRWVKENIAAFGGDPSNILIFAKLLWKAALGGMRNMVQSPPLSECVNLARLGPNLSELQLPLLSVHFQQRRYFNCNLYKDATDPVIKTLTPSIDNYVLEDSPGTVLRQIAQSQVPLLAGWNEDVELLFLSQALPCNPAAEFEADIPLSFGSTVQQAFSKADLYPASTDAQANATISALIDDLIIRC